jgi:hypothetical protein
MAFSPSTSKLQQCLVLAPNSTEDEPSGSEAAPQPQSVQIQAHQSMLPQPVDKRRSYCEESADMRDDEEDAAELLDQR